MWMTGDQDRSATGRLTPTPTPSRPSHKDSSLVDRGRKALRSFIEQVLFSARHPSGEAFRERALGWFDQPSKAPLEPKASVMMDERALKKRLLKAVDVWKPTRGWEKFEFGNGQTFYSGDLGGYGPFHLVLEGGKIVTVTVEIEGLVVSEKVSRLIFSDA